MRLKTAFCLSLGLTVFALPSCNPKPSSSAPKTTPSASAPKTTPSAAAAKPKPDKEGETWTINELLSYLNKNGVKAIQFGDAIKDGDNFESVELVDDEAAVVRKKNDASRDSLEEKKSGIGVVSIIRYRSADLAKQQPLPDETSSLQWGRFIAVVLGAEPKGSPKESGNARSRKMIEKMRQALGI